MTVTPAAAAANIVDRLSALAADAPAATALRWLDTDGGHRDVTRRELNARARCVAAALREGKIEPGERALLLYPPGLDYVAGFLGCLYAGVIAVPVFPPGDARGFERVLAIAADADAGVALTDRASLDTARQGLGDPDGARRLRWQPTDGLPDTLGDGWSPGAITADSLAFLQYTSGSTAVPKGVLVSHGNLLHNCAVIAQVLAAGPDTRGVSWLPPYHDMGLIGGILQPLYSGFPGLLMAPSTFLYRPARWLQAITEFRATASAAPNFAYAECVRRITDAELSGLDLRTWRHAMVGAEPVRGPTLDAFAARFADAGFVRDAFLPCYGLAEATLLVTGAKLAPRPAERLLDRVALASGRVDDTGSDSGSDSGSGSDAVRLVGCGGPPGPDLVAVVDPAVGAASMGTMEATACEPGTVGEIWVSGPSVTAGYWANDELTAETFGGRLAGVAGDRRWLRTGDLGFFDGTELYITGRLKDLIVVRGANHYPQDIEQTAERAHPALLPGRGAAFSVEDGAAEHVVLVLEAAARDVELPAVADAALAAVTAAHGLALHEVVLVRRGGVPRTSSGKVRRRETRIRYLDGTLQTLATAAPVTTGVPGVPGRAGPGARNAGSAIAGLVELVAAVLECAPGAVDPDRPLVAQGMDSLRAARLAAELTNRLGTEVELADLLAAASLTELADLLGPAAAGTLAGSPLPRLADGARIPASLGQERLWLLDALGAGAAYHVTGLVWLPAEPDVAAVRQALQVLVERHEALRTGVRLADDGVLTQAVLARAEVAVPVVDAHCLDEVRAWARQPFRLAEPPLLRAALYRIGADSVLALCVHHIVVDGWSFEVLAREFAAVYGAIRAGRAPVLAAQAVRYRDFAAWQGVDRPDAGGVEYWRSALAGAVPPEISGVAVATAAAFGGGTVPVELPAAVVAGLRGVAESQRATLFMVLVAGFAALLGRWSGGCDVVLGTASAGRSRPELADLVGFLVNTVPLRVALDGDPAFRDLVGRARTACLDAYRHQDVPFERIVHEVAPGRDATDHRPLVRHLLVLQEARPPLELGGAAAPTTVLPPDGAKFDLELELTPSAGGGLSGWLGYATEVFGRPDAERMVAALHRMLHAAASEPDQRLSALPLLTDAEHATVVAGFSGAGTPPVTEPTVPARFEAQVDATPHAAAVVDPGGGVTSYAELDTMANTVAHQLRRLGVGVEDRVAVCLPRGVWLSAALLGVLKSGAAYLPLDQDYPAERLAYLMRDGAPSVVISTPDLVGEWSGPAPLLDVDRLPGPVGPPSRLPPVFAPANAAYVLYTSGSTGHPKGAVNTHAGLVNRLSWAQAWHPVQAEDRVLQKTPIGFDVSVWELLLPLVVGATLVYARPDSHRDPDYLHRLIDEQRVSVCHFVPAMLRAFLDTPSGDHPSLRSVVCSGEELPVALAEQFLDRFPAAQLQNLYGPTEAAIDVSTQRVAAPMPRRLPRRVPIGRPVPGTELYVLDAHLRPQPVGVAGELFIGGVQLARGYHGRPALTAQRFVPHPFAAGQRLYASGDRARWLPDGTLEYLGRLDHQVKIRGHRIEPAEIEAALLDHPDVAAAAVLARPDQQGQLTLVAHLCAAAERPPDPARLREFLAQRLPGPMVPAAFTWLDRLPLLPNGKLDRSALAALPVELAAGGAAYAPPQTPIERMLADIWAEVLGVPRVGRHDGFFDLGGHSLLAVRVLSRIRAEFGVELAVTDLLTGHLTVEHLATLLQRRQLEQTSADELQELLAMLAELSDEEAAQRLADYNP
jgi:amino acid adenylation domain-containing protein